jgi:FAD-dependent oxidoreductase domain-containing protein 1
LISSETEFDIVVVGAGILGMSAAYHLMKGNPGKKVLVVDREAAVAQGNTGRSNAMFRNTFTSVDNQRLADASISYYHSVQDSGIDIGVDPIGYLWTMSERGLSKSASHVSKMKENGIEMRYITSDDLERQIPGFLTSAGGSEQGKAMGLEDVAGAYLGSKCGRLAPEKLVEHYRAEFIRLGGRLFLGADVVKLGFGARNPLGIEGEPFVWQDAQVEGVTLRDGRRISARKVVVAGGAWNNEILDPSGIDGHIKAKKRQLFALSARGKPALSKLLRVKGFNRSGTIPFIILPRTGLFIKPVRESEELWVGCEDEIERPFITVPEHDLEKYLPEPAYYEANIHQVLREYFPAFDGSRPARMWAGLYSYNTIDNLPYVFSDHGVIAVGGDSGSGVMKGDSLGRVVEAVYRDGEAAVAELYGGTTYAASRLSFEHRNVEREEWVI